MLGIIFTVAKSFPSSDHLSEGGWDGPSRAVEGEAGSAPEDDACTPIDILHFDMTLLVIKSIRTSSTIFSAALSSSDIQTWVSWLGCKRNLETTVNSKEMISGFVLKLSVSKNYSQCMA
jgi:hypothetical protein